MNIKSDKTMIDYLEEYGSYSFEERVFGPVDSLIISQFAYLKFDGLVPELHSRKRPVALSQLAKHSLIENLFADERYREHNKALFEGMVKSKRFGNLCMKNYINVIDTERETQFSAITICLENGPVYIAYRGTDETLIGWREDCNLTFPKPVPGQVMSVEYLNTVAKKINGEFLVGGHSKGGNLAVYASMMCQKKIQDRIQIIYCHDGPGIHPALKELGNFDVIAGRIHKTIPYASTIGLLFNFDEAYKVVASCYKGILQHDPFSWIVEEGSFCYQEEVREGNLLIDNALNNWIMSLEDTQKETFIETLFRVLAASKVDNTIDMVADWKQSLQGMATEMYHLDQDTKKAITEILRVLFEQAGEDARRELQQVSTEIARKIRKTKKIKKFKNNVDIHNSL